MNPMKLVLIKTPATDGKYQLIFFHEGQQKPFFVADMDETTEELSPMTGDTFSSGRIASNELVAQVDTLIND